MAAKKVFVTFDYENHRYYKNLLVSWNKNREFDFEFYDAALHDALDSANGDYIKSVIKPIIQRASHVLCLVGKKCAKSQWFDWEVQTAVALGKPLAAVKLEPSCETPKALIAHSATWAPTFAFDAIRAALEPAQVSTATASPASPNPQAAA